MLTFETHNIEPALAELSEAASRYFHDRLIAPEMRPEVSVTVRLVAPTGGEMGGSDSQIGLQRQDMLAIKRKGKMTAPFMFDCVIARPWEIEAHEWQPKLVSEFVDRYAKDEGV